ncbi:MAG: hypothetical protein Q8Q48_03970 [Candidatus Staskawiczbacteria bacterium]|nr:hypothetical protein [Candidatus Staskawiczbacteria bacterium]
MVRKKQKTDKNDVIQQILLHLHNCSSQPVFGSGVVKRLDILGSIFDALDGYDKKEVKKAINDLSKQKLIAKKKKYNNSVLITLTEKGKLRALNISFRRFYNRKEKWDGRWRMIAFDIPDKCRKGRDALRYRFRSGGFYELQESVFLYPYDCEKEIRGLIEIFKLQEYVRFGLLERIDGEENIKTKMHVG